ncbi:MAG: hypothetical protein JWO52_895 [Gammaproteobacteria bacterium]|jgi:hypothetical protein|nr:hypothetical protein [Gammaproteobacteria bacterium]
MIGDISIGGVYIPSLLLLVLVAVVLTALLSRFLAAVGFYRLVAYRSLTDIAFFLLLLAAAVWISGSWGLRS